MAEEDPLTQLKIELVIVIMLFILPYQYMDEIELF